MKKLITLLLVLTGMVSTANADETERTVYYAVQSSTVGTYSVKLNINIGDNNTWRQYDMSKTGLTYTNSDITYDIYSCKCWDKYGGVDVMQFQLYDGNQWKSEKQPFSSWTLASNYDGKMYVHDSGFSTFSASSYSRSVTENKFGTICLPFAATVTGATVYQITSKVVDASSNVTAINLEEVNSLSAGVAYIFKATGTTLTATLSGSYTGVASGNAMMGNYDASADVATGNYIVYNNKIRKAGTGVTVGRYKGYIIPGNIKVATSRSANFLNFDDETTGIAGVEMNDDAEQKVVYNLNGQRVMNPTKGLYIVNGKKVIIK